VFKEFFVSEARFGRVILEDGNVGVAATIVASEAAQIVLSFIL
jgi:hypothetical protein